MSRLEEPSFNEPDNETTSQEKQPGAEPETGEPVNEDRTELEDATEKDNARIDEINKQIEKADAKHKSGGPLQEARKRNREDILKINAKKRAAGIPLIQPKKDGVWSKFRSLFGGKDE